MLKLVTLLGLLIGSSVLAQSETAGSRGSGVPAGQGQAEASRPNNDAGSPFPGGEWIADFLFVPVQDRITGENSSYALSFTVDTQFAMLQLSCNKGAAEWRVWSDSTPLVFSTIAGMTWRFDENFTRPEMLVQADPKKLQYGVVVYAREEIISFSKAAYYAKRVGIRVSSGGGNIDFFFPIKGYFKAVKRLPCARAFGF